MVTNTGLIPKQSTVDFVGIYKLIIDGRSDDTNCHHLVGQGIAFDAKETLSKTSFPLANIKQHQLLYLEYFKAVGGDAFFLIHFKNMHKDLAFITPVTLIRQYWDGEERKSIPYDRFNKDLLIPIDDYLRYTKDERILQAI